MYRPTFNSKMRSLGVPFEQINVEQHVKRIYNRVSPIDAVLPATTPVLVRRGRANDFAVSGPIPATHTLTAVWSIDGAPVAVGPQFSTNGHGIAIGGHTLSVVVSDATPFVRNDPSGLLRATRSWSITVTPGQTPPLDFDGNGREELAVFRQSSGQMFVHGGATTSWGIPGDVPVPGDYAGDGTVDLRGLAAVLRDLVRAELSAYRVGRTRRSAGGRRLRRQRHDRHRGVAAVDRRMVRPRLRARGLGSAG